MATDNTAPTLAGNVNADPDPSNGVSAYYSTLDTMGRSGRSGQVLVTVNPCQRMTYSLNGENFCLYTGQTLWMVMREALYVKQDGIVTY